MSHYLIELLLWIALAYGLGCLLGWFFKNVFSAAPSQPVVPAPVVPVAVEPVVKIGEDGKTHSGSDIRKN